MIEPHNLFIHGSHLESSKEVQLFSIISESFFQPFSLSDNLLIILTALTAGSGVGFNRAMLFLADGDKLRGEMWLGPGSAEEANSIWQVLSTPGIGYAEIIEHNRSLMEANKDSLTMRIRKHVFPINQGEKALIPVLAVKRREVILVKDARNEILVDKDFLGLIDTEEFLCLPLLAGEEVLGEIVLDNAILKNPIQVRDIELARICSLIAGNYIYTANLQKRIVEIKKLAAMGEMAMYVTHQLKTPLATIGGFTHQLLDPQASETRRERNLQIIQNEIKRLEEILANLTDFLQVEIKELIPVNVLELLDIVLHTVKPLLKQRKVKIIKNVDKDLSAILCDPVHVGEAIRNVIDNAMDAMSKGGEILLHGYKENSNWAVIAVQDKGKGIPESIRDKLFEAFFSTKEKGMGLGLAYVKRVVDACGGRIEVESEQGKGTTFKLFFKIGERG